MSDDILHTGRADIHHPKGPLTAGRVARSGSRRGGSATDSLAAWYDNNPVVQGIAAAAYERGGGGW